MIKYAYRTYSITLVHITKSEFQGQTFIANMEEDASWNMTIDDGPANVAIDDFVAKVHLPKDILNDCTTDAVTNTSIYPVAYLLFYTNVLFLSMPSDKQRVGSIITSARLNCSVDLLSSPISITYNLYDKVSKSPANPIPKL